MRKILLMIIGLFLILSCANYASARPIGKVTVRAVDESGVPTQGAEAKVTFKFAKERGTGLDTKAIAGTTDKKGLFTATGEGMASISVSAKKEGYYKSGKGYEFTSRSLLLRRWEPWNPTIEVILKKKRNPVPMYIKGTHGMKIPAFDQPVGFDLEKGDWVSPYGKGAIKDFIFNMHVVDRAYTDYECSFSLTFLNTHDGIQEYFFDENDQSYYKWPFEAPVEGYVSKIMKEKSMSPDKGYRSNEKKNIHYIFRVRTKVDKDGNIVKALYGKLGGEFKFSPEGEIVFGYYLNPDGTRNLEEDKERNLFKNE